MTNLQPPQPVEVVTTIGTIYSWVDTPTTVALLFGLAGAFFIGIYILRRIRAKKSV